MTLLLTGAQLYLFLGSYLALVVICWAIGALGRYQQGYECGWTAAGAAQPPCPRCMAAAEADTLTFPALDADTIAQALTIMGGHAPPARPPWPAQPAAVLRGRVVDVEITPAVYR